MATDDARVVMVDRMDGPSLQEGNTAMDTYEQTATRLMGVHRSLMKSTDLDPKLRRDVFNAIDKALGELRQYRKTGDTKFLSYAILHANEAEIAYCGF